MISEKNQTFLITVAILEGRHYAWMNMDSAVIIRIDNKKKTTSVKERTDCPFYNEYFVFEYLTTLERIVDKQITITVIQPRNIWRKRKTLGYVTLDVGTIWNQKNHQFYHRWAILSTPKTEVFSGPRGYMKLDISVLTRGQVPRTPVNIINDDIEGNLLLPDGKFSERQKATYIFDVYRCKNIVEKPSNIFTDDTVTSKSKSAGPTTFVQISFAGISVKTAIKKNTASPEFNERLKIVDLFPPLSQRIRIEIRVGDTIKKKAIAVRYVNLKSISNDKDEGFLPTFGPIWFHMYSSSNSGGYVGSILMSMQTEIEDLLIPDARKTIFIESIAPLNENKYFHNQGITIFCCIFEITAINKKYAGQPMSFRITAAETLAQKKLLASGDDILTNETPAQKPKNIQKNYYSIPLMEEKPCLWLTTEANFKKSVYNTNILHRMVTGLKTKLNEIEKLFNSFRVKALSNEIDTKLQDSVDYILTTGKKYMDIVNAYPVDYNTNIGRERRKLCIRELNDIVRRTEFAHDKLSKKKTFRKLQKFCYRIEDLIEDIQDSLPDIFLWVIRGKKKLVFERVPMRDIIYSQVLEENGQFCGKKRTLCFYGSDKNQKNLMMKVNVLFVACLDRHKNELSKLIPLGYRFPEDIEHFPSVLVSERQYVFQLRAYIFQGRISSGLDKSGLADPFIRIIVKNVIKETQVIYGCLNPIWDETLVFDNIILYGSKSYIKSNTPTILLEVFDQDQLCMTECIGRAIIIPDIVLDEDEYEPPKLKWHDIFYKDEILAEILASFEFIELTEGKHLIDLEKSKQKIMSIPKGIKPDLVAHRMEVLFWGVRDLGRVNLMYINRPRITVLCGDQVLNSDTIENASKCLNFPNQSKSLSLILPTQEEYAPPVRFKIYDSRRFGVFVFAGVHITHITHFMLHPIHKEERIKKLAGTGYKSIDSLTSRSSSSLKIRLKDVDALSVSDTPDIVETTEKSCFLVRFFRNCCKSKGNQVGRSVSSLGTYELLEHDIDEDEDDDYDWWTKYYASLEASSDDIVPDKIRKLKIYGSECENQPQFRGFSDMLTSFDLYKGKKTGDELLDEENVTATFKGAVKIYRQPAVESDYVTAGGVPLDRGVFHNFPDNSPLRYILRVYCVRAFGLRPKDLNGKSDPYLYLTMNNKIVNDLENVVMRNVNPVFGRCFELDGMFPEDHTLKVAVWDYDYSSADDEIGETCIDLEKRYYTRHRAHCGIPDTYEISGYCAWRDQHKPSIILSDLCRRWNTDPPEYGERSVNIGFKKFAPVSFSPSGDANHDREVLALSALRRWNEMPVVGFELVPEHVETRSLYHPSKPGIEQGKLQLWIDIFPVIDLPPPKKVNITPRVPGRYELRIIIWNTAEVVLDEDDFYTGERKSDIYVKGWFTESSEAQYTDVHYRSLTGEGNFNWRFVFTFEYLPTENKVVVRKKESLFAIDETEFKLPCKLTLQVWDNDTFSKDDFLGTLSLELSKMHRPARTVKKCDLSMMDKTAPTINLFRTRRTKGWWPFRNFDPKLKKDVCTGKLEAEIEILTFEEAAKEAAGLGRHEPQALPAPKRPDTSFSWFKSPFNAIRYVFCKMYRCRIIIGFAVLLVIFFILLAIYSIPGYTVMKMFHI